LSRWVPSGSPESGKKWTRLKPESACRASTACQGARIRASVACHYVTRITHRVLLGEDGRPSDEPLAPFHVAIVPNVAVIHTGNPWRACSPGNAS
jgi:hypothetical protein